MKIDIVHVETSTLTEDPSNARQHGPTNTSAVRASIRQWGFVEPLVVQRSSNQVIGGNLRLQVAREMGTHTVPVVYVDLNKKEAAALGIALNRTSELAEWNYETLSEILQGFKEDSLDDLLAASGWSDDDLSNLINAQWNPPEGTGSPDEHSRNESSSGDPKEREGVGEVTFSPQQWDVVCRALSLAKDNVGESLSSAEGLVVICDAYLTACS